VSGDPAVPCGSVVDPILAPLPPCVAPHMTTSPGSTPPVAACPATSTLAAAAAAALSSAITGSAAVAAAATDAVVASACRPWHAVATSARPLAARGGITEVAVAPWVARGVAAADVPAPTMSGAAGDGAHAELAAVSSPTERATVVENLGGGGKGLSLLLSQFYSSSSPYQRMYPHRRPGGALRPLSRAAPARRHRVRPKCPRTNSRLPPRPARRQTSPRAGPPSVPHSRGACIICSCAE